MFADRPILTALSATDLERAKHFCAEKLGCRFECSSVEES